jgi:hypothetical protein
VGADPKIVPKGDHHAGYRYPLHDHQISDSSNPFAVHQLAVAKCRYGSLATELQCPRDVRFAPDSDETQRFGKRRRARPADWGVIFYPRCSGHGPPPGAGQMAIGIGQHATNIQQHLLASNAAQSPRRDHMFYWRIMARLGVFQSGAAVDNYDRNGTQGRSL